MSNCEENILGLKVHCFEETTGWIHFTMPQMKCRRGNRNRLKSSSTTQ